VTFFFTLIVVLRAFTVQAHAAGNQPAMTGASNFNDYEFIAPEGWQVQRNSDHLRIQNMASGCLILIFVPQPSSGNLEQDATAVFETMYKGWQFQKTGRQQYLLSKGFLPKGLPYYMLEAPMSKLSADGASYEGFEDGAALVAGSGNQIAIVAVRHNPTSLAHRDCEKYESWKRFFNSFTVKSAPIAKAAEDISSRIVGAWTVSEAGGVGEYIFAANGHYSRGATIASATTATDYDSTQLHITTYPFQGDGSYSINGHQLTMSGRGAGDIEHARVRVEDVNYGGTGWTVRLCLLKTGVEDGKENEVCYGRRDR
jgi:hypothetical protein